MLFRIPAVTHVLGNKGIFKDHMRRLLVQQHEADRSIYKAMVSDKTLPLPLRLQVQRLFETEMPVDSAANRVRNRCVLTGRPRGVYKFCRLSRIMIRQLTHYGHLPGVAKASW